MHSAEMLKSMIGFVQMGRENRNNEVRYERKGGCFQNGNSHFFIEPISADLSGVCLQMIPAVTSQINRPLNANKQHMGAYRKGGVDLQRWGGNATPAPKTQRLFIIPPPKRKVVTTKFP